MGWNNGRPSGWYPGSFERAPAWAGGVGVPTHARYQHGTTLPPLAKDELRARIREIITEFVDGPHETYDTQEGYDAAVTSAVNAITALLHSVASAKV
jgi:hypothetical protein